MNILNTLLTNKIRNYLVLDRRSVFDSRMGVYDRCSMLSISPGIAPTTFYFDHTALRASFPTGANYASF